jgi:hypothetical protein
MSEQEKPLPKPLPPLENNKASLVALDYESSLQSTKVLSESKHLQLQENLWTVDPLRLCLENGNAKDTLLNQLQFPFQQEIELPLYKFKPKASQLYTILLSQLYISIEQEDLGYYNLVKELPFATASFFPPTPPAKDKTTTPSHSPPIILPFESYASVYAETDTWDSQDPAHIWLYGSSPRNSTATLINQEESKWESIFQPQSTFKDNVYMNTNRSEPNTAGRDQQEDMKATLPQLMPTPPLKPSPVLTINEVDNDSQMKMAQSDSTQTFQASGSYVFPQCASQYFDSQAFARCDSQSTMLNSDHYDMLQQIRGQANTTFPVSPSFKEDPEMKPKRSYWTAKRMFCIGFIFPLLWFVGSFRTTHSLKWKKRCRLAAFYFSLSLCVVVLIFALKSAGSAATRQSQTDNIRAIIAN